MKRHPRSFEIWSLVLLWSLDVGAWCFHSGEVDAPHAHQLSRCSLAVAKNFSTAFVSFCLSAVWKRFNSAVNASRERVRFLRLANAMSRHISGEPDAMRVVSRKPVAHSPTWAF